MWKKGKWRGRQWLEGLVQQQMSFVYDSTDDARLSIVGISVFTIGSDCDRMTLESCNAMEFQWLNWFVIVSKTVSDINQSYQDSLECFWFTENGARTSKPFLEVLAVFQIHINSRSPVTILRRIHRIRAWVGLINGWSSINRQRPNEQAADWQELKGSFEWFRYFESRSLTSREMKSHDQTKFEQFFRLCKLNLIIIESFRLDVIEAFVNQTNETFLNIHMVQVKLNRDNELESVIGQLVHGKV